MCIRDSLNLVVAGLSATFVVVLIAAEIQSTRASVREEIEAANRVASQLLGQLASIYSNIGGPNLVLEFLEQTGRVRANEKMCIRDSGWSLAEFSGERNNSGFSGAEDPAAGRRSASATASVTR